MKNNIVEQVDSTFLFIIGVSALLLIGITAAMIYFVIKYNIKRNPKPTSDSTGNTTLELLWTIIPTILVLLMFYFGYSGFKSMRSVPGDAMIIKTTGKMWVWTYEYANGKKSDTLFVPVNKPVKIELQSLDVNHSFYLPDFRVKEDAVPGRTNYLWFQPTEIREYYIECAEYCGLNHAYMLSTMSVLPDKQFNEWYNFRPAVDSTKTDSLKTNAKDTLKTK